MKTIILRIAWLVGLFWGVVPFALRRKLFWGLAVLETRIGPPAASLNRLLLVADDVELAINERATAYGDGVHPKHRLTRYHDFFVSHTPAGSRVLDIGCGYGAVAATVAERVPGCFVVGIDIDEQNVAQARAKFQRENIEFRAGDARIDIGGETFDVIVLSNILEHLEDRVGFLRAVTAKLCPKLVLIRVPLFERDWKMPLRREIGANYFSDSTHFIEHTMQEFEAEMSAAELFLVSHQEKWGEIWAVCHPRKT